MNRRKKSDEANAENGEPATKGPRMISIDLPPSVSEECAAVAKATGLQETKVRELVRTVATNAACLAVLDVKAIVKAHLTSALG